jgi:signal transduction histidine kinase
VGLKPNVDTLRRSPEHEQLWLESQRLVQQCISELRTFSQLLHPPMMDAAGLASAVEWFVEGFRQRTGMEVTLTVRHDPGRLPDAIKLTVFRALQKALTNVHRHAGASAAEVRIVRAANRIELRVKDNGRGIQQGNLNCFLQMGNGIGVGLSSWRERVRNLGGDLCIESDGSVTAITILIPESHVANPASSAPEVWAKQAERPQ